MRHSEPIRFAAFACLALSTALYAQGRGGQRAKPSATVAVPATFAPTAMAASAVPPTPAELPARPAEVRYADGLLTVSASNSSLNQILRDISHETGMKITGGVREERVFGQYGPESAAQVLNSLLDGTGSNMLLVGSNGVAPAELVLTPRTGGVTPPNPNAAAEAESEHEEQSYRPGSPADEPAPVSELAPPVARPQPPNGVKTPQDIFNELQKMRQQQAAQQRAKPQ